MGHQEFQPCIETCYKCATACMHCATECLTEQDVKQLAQCIKLNQDCSNMCLLAAKLMSRNSAFAGQACNLCAQICDACATECETHPDMRHCLECASMCRQCAKECRKIFVAA